MRAVLIWTPLAREDLLDIYVRIGLANRAAADRIYVRLRGRADALRDNPRLGVARPEIRPHVRLLIERPWLIAYRIKPDDEAMPVREIEIIRVVDGRRDLERLF